MKVKLQDASAAQRKAIRAEVKEAQKKEKQRAAEVAAVSDVSEVETVKEPKTFFNVDINLDNLKGELEAIKAMISG